MAKTKYKHDSALKGDRLGFSLWFSIAVQGSTVLDGDSLWLGAVAGSECFLLGTRNGKYIYFLLEVSAEIGNGLDWRLGTHNMHWCLI
jgi:hypothetical protein